ncbi:hypothetical protein ACFX5Q_05395 [Mesorhizobium sp. IMUNJ 23033]|uniref:hypothetical protein n=1 Tax=Mesorhizobium sp. IMUNJ 23033 TaxID=3378039 RepID=UPI00384BC8AE
MPKFRFETTDGKTTIFEEELASADLASPRAIEIAPRSYRGPSDRRRSIRLDNQGL